MLDNNTLQKQRVEQFDLKHGPESVVSGKWLLFSDGAMREVKQPGELCEPPTDEMQLAKLQVRYREEQLKQSQRRCQEVSSRVTETPSQRVARWIEENGDDGIMVNGWMIYSNGAKREAAPLGVMYDPPKDPYQLAKAKLQYREALLKRAADAFNEKKQHLMSLAEASRRSGFAPPPERELNELKDLQKIATECQQNVDAARKEVEQNKPEWMRRDEDVSAENREGGERFIADLKAIKV